MLVCGGVLVSLPSDKLVPVEEAGEKKDIYVGVGWLLVARLSDGAPVEAGEGPPRAFLDYKP